MPRTCYPDEIKEGIDTIFNAFGIPRTHDLPIPKRMFLTLHCRNCGIGNIL